MGWCPAFEEEMLTLLEGAFDRVDDLALSVAKSGVRKLHALGGCTASSGRLATGFVLVNELGQAAMDRDLYRARVDVENEALATMGADFDQHELGSRCFRTPPANGIV